MKKERKHYSSEEKVAFYRATFWISSRFPICVRNWGYDRRYSTAGRKSFSRTERPPSKHRTSSPSGEEKQSRIEFLEKKVQTKDEVLAELMAEHIALKKSLGEL